jgi:selenocysteine lyase/cysteine desulfurase
VAVSSRERTPGRLDVSDEFDLPADRVWLNAAHQGPLPKRGIEAAERMIRWKARPHHLQPSRAFTDLPDELRRRLARLIGAKPAEIVIANSASYGLHLIANGLELRAGDEIMVAANDFPSDILPWLRLQGHGVEVRQIQPTDAVPAVEEVRAAVTRRTRVLCLSWVHSFSGHMVDLEAIGSFCREAGVLFVVNGSQAIGAIPIDVAAVPVDALVGVGFKWLCGPYGTGFAWLGERAWEQVRPTKLYWLTALSTDDLAKPDLDLRSLDPPASGRHDIFGTANFLNNAPLAESIALISETGVDAIQSHDLDLAARLVEGLDPRLFETQSRGRAGMMSTLVFVLPTQTSSGAMVERLADAGIDISERSGMMRFSPHFYNTGDEIDHVVAVMNRPAG